MLNAIEIKKYKCFNWWCIHKNLFKAGFFMMLYIVQINQFNSIFKVIIKLIIDFTCKLKIKNNRFVILMNHSKDYN